MNREKTAAHASSQNIPGPPRSERTKASATSEAYPSARPSRANPISTANHEVSPSHQPTNRPTHPPTHRRTATDPPTDQPTDRLINRPTDRPTHQPTDRDRPTNRPTNRRSATDSPETAPRHEGVPPRRPAGAAGGGRRARGLCVSSARRRPARGEGGWLQAAGRRQRGASAGLLLSAISAPRCRQPPARFSQTASLSPRYVGTASGAAGGGREDGVRSAARAGKGLSPATQPSRHAAPAGRSRGEGRPSRAGAVQITRPGSVPATLRRRRSVKGESAARGRRAVPCLRHVPTILDVLRRTWPCATYFTALPAEQWML